MLVNDVLAPWEVVATALRREFDVNSDLLRRPLFETKAMPIKTLGLIAGCIR